MCAKKTLRVCRLILPGVRVCSPFEEGILYLWIIVVACWVGGEEGGFKKMQEVGSLLGYLTAVEKLFLFCQSGTTVPRLTNADSAPWRPSHTAAGMLHTKSFPKQ